MATRDYVERYNAGAICLECAAAVIIGQPCAECEAERKMACDLGFMSSDPKSPSYIPPVLRGAPRESLPEDLSEPPKLPENAGRHIAPDFLDPFQYPESDVQRVPPDQSGVTDNVRDLNALRAARAFPRPR